MPDHHPNIITHWLAAGHAHAAGFHDQDALAELNAALGTRHSPARLYEWKSGRRPVPRDVARFAALEGGLAHLLEAQGIVVPGDEITDAQLEALADALL